ncbi:MAG: hypothetical protein JWN80_901 [Microbacteriaceae bacterium]|jgi:uncharacterized membrane protein HdeD (DUF308 family)|nr:hypothetical protein [Microbacteriaceae bacterium]
MIRINRGALIAVSVIGIVLGIAALALPGVSLITVAIIFGAYLVASGIFRIVTALTVSSLSTMLRWITAGIGLLVVLAGIFCLADPFSSLSVLGILIGIGWIAEGAVDILAAIRHTVTPAWYGWVSGVISVIAGVVAVLLPAAALLAFITIGAILLIVVSVSTLLMMPRHA